MRWLRRLIVLFLVGLLGLYPLLAPPPHRIDQAHCDLIKEGMTKDEVESIFGVPSGEYDFAERKFSAYQFRISAVHLKRASFYYTTALALTVKQRQLNVRSTWTGRHGAFTVSFDEHGRVVSTRGPQEVTIVPPWQDWWKKLTE